MELALVPPVIVREIRYSTTYLLCFVVKWDKKCKWVKDLPGKNICFKMFAVQEPG
jgi:hypothetical protein